MKTIPHFLKALLIFSGLVSVLPLAGCMEEEMVPLTVRGIDHTDYGRRKGVVGFDIDGKFSAGIGGTTFGGIDVPRKWKPGMTVTISWAAVETDEDVKTSTTKQHSAVVEIPEYTKEDLFTFYVHIYPGDKVKVVVARHGMGSIFHPLPREDWPVQTPDLITMHRYLSGPNDSYWKLTKKDLEWAKQWGVVDGKCQDATGKCSYQPYAEYVEKLQTHRHVEVMGVEYAEYWGVWVFLDDGFPVPSLEWETRCCFQIPKKWKPGIKVKLNVVLNPNHNDREKEYSDIVEIPEYSEEDNVFHVHVYHDNKAKVLVTRHERGSIFYPLPKEDWGSRTPDLAAMHSYLSNPDASHWKLTTKDLEWAKQWGVVDGKCQDATGKCPYQPYAEWKAKHEAELKNHGR